jgi:hypothetical protein
MGRFKEIVEAAGGGLETPPKRKRGGKRAESVVSPPDLKVKPMSVEEEDVLVKFAGGEVAPPRPEAVEGAPGEAGGESTASRTPLYEQRRIAREQAQTREREKIEHLREQLARAEDTYAQAYAVAKSRMGLIRRTLGIENIERDPAVQQARQAYVRAREDFNNLNINRLQERLGSGQISEAQFNQETQSLLADIFVNHDLSLQNKKMQFRQAEDLRRGTFAGRVEAWWNRMVDGYRKLPLWAKVGASLGLFAFGGGAVAVSGMIAMRIMGGAASAKGTQELLQSFADRWRQRTGGLRAGQRILGFEQMSLDQRVGALQDLINNYHGDVDQRFVRRERGDIIRRHIGIFTGVIVGSGVLSGYIREVIGDWWTGGKGGGAPVIPEKIPTAPHGHVINSGENIWKVTRDIYMENPRGYGYDPSDPKIGRLFQSFKNQGILGRLDIDVDNFSDLSDSDKIKIWAENRTANSVNKLAEIQGGRIRDLVHAGDTVTLKPDGEIIFKEASGIKAGYLSDVQRPRGAVDTSQFDQQIEAARARGAAADARLREIRGPIAEKLAAEAAGVQAIDNLRTQELMDFVQSKIYGPGTGVDWKEPAREFRKRMLEPFITSDQPMGPPANVHEQRQYWEAAKTLAAKLGPAVGNESTENWVARGIAEKRMYPEDIVMTLKRVVNE